MTALPARPGARAENPAQWEQSQAFLDYASRSILTGAVAYLLAILVFAHDQAARAFLVGALAAIAMAARAFARRGDVRAAVQVLGAGSWLYVTATSFFLGGVNGTTIIFYPLVIIAVGWQLGARAAVWTAIATIVATLGFVGCEWWNVLPAPPATPPVMRWIIDSFVFFFSASMIAYVVRSYRARIDEVSALGTDLVQRTSELQVREAELNRAQAVAHVGSWVFDLGTDTLRISAETCRIFGIPAGTTGNQDAYLARTHADDRAALGTAWRAALHGERSFDFEHRIVVDDSIRWVRQVAEFEFDAAGVARRAVGTTQDTTDRKRADLAAQATQDKLRATLDAIPDLIFETGLDGTFHAYHTPRLNLLAVPPEVFLGKKVLDVLPPATAEVAMGALREANATGWSFGMEYELEMPGGTRAFELSVSRMAVPEGQEPRFITVARDITERKSAEAALRRSEASYRGLFDSVTEAIYILDAEGRFLDVNAGAEVMYGYPRAELIGQTPEFVGQPGRNDLVRVGELLRLALAGQPQQFQFWGRRKSGECFPKDVWLNRGTYFGREVVIALAIDITERLRGEEALRQSEERLRQAQKMEAIGQLAGGVAHDFNNLLTVILGNASSLVEETLDPDEVRTLAKDVLDSADRGAELTRQLLTFGRKQVIQVRPLNLNDLIGNLMKMLRGLLGEHIIMKAVYSEREPVVVADAGMLEQVIVNLAVNARDAMPEGGSLTIATKCVDFDGSDAGDRQELRIGHFVAFSVTDTGTGMDAATQSRIFEPFFTTKPAGKGSGLGLATVHGIVTQHEGWIEVTSKVGQGSEFTVLLPAVIEADGKAESAERPAPTLIGGQETILVVEDEALVRQLAMASLKRRRYRVLEAESGLDAIRIWNERRGNIDLLLTDMVMPGMSGRELARRLRLEDPKLKVIYTSGYSRDWLDPESDLLPNEVFLPKPYSPSALAQAVRRAIDGS